MSDVAAVTCMWGVAGIGSLHRNEMQSRTIVHYAANVPIKLNSIDGEDCQTGCTVLYSTVSGTDSTASSA